MLPPVASLNQAITETEANSVVRQRTLTARANVENSLACREKKCLHNLSGSRSNADVCSAHQKAAFLKLQRFSGDFVSQWTVSLCNQPHQNHEVQSANVYSVHIL